MKKILMHLLFASSLVAQAKAQVVFETNFSAATPAQNLTGQLGWSNSTSTGYPGIGDSTGLGCLRAQVVTRNLTAPTGIAYYPATRAVQFTNGVSMDGVGRFLQTATTLPDETPAPSFNTGEKYYVSFLLEVNDATTTATAGQLVRINQGTFEVAMRLYVQKNAAGKVRFGIEKNAGAVYSGYDYDLNKTYLIVMRLESVAGDANNIAALFVNPTVTEPATPTASTANGTDYTPRRFAIYLNQTAANIPSGYLSSIRVGKTWANLGITAGTGTNTKDLAAAQMLIQPTSAQNEVTISLSEAPPSVSTLSIVDLSGRIVISEKLGVGEMRKTLNISNLAKGFYVIRLENSHYTTTEKFVKN